MFNVTLISEIETLLAGKIVKVEFTVGVPLDEIVNGTFSELTFEQEF